MTTTTSYHFNHVRYITECRLNNIRTGRVYIANQSSNLIATQYYEDGNLLYITVNANRLHNESGPSWISWYNNGQVRQIHCHLRGTLHNDSGPAIIEYYPNGQVKYISYLQNGISHNEHGPAIIEYYPNGQVKYISYFRNGIRHNDRDAAYIRWFEDGGFDFMDFLINGKIRDTILYNNSMHKLPAKYRDCKGVPYS